MTAGTDESRRESDTTVLGAEPSAAPSPAPSPAPSAAAFEVGTTLGRYVLLEELGRGGMAVVYVAYDPELDRRVALKVVESRARRRRALDQERLLREAQALARLSHPNVVHVYDVGICDGGVYIAMELVAGQTLFAWLAESRRRWREVLDVYIHAGRGLAAAHAAGLVHLDFKPSNVVLGEDGRVRVVDFGLAREPRGLPSLDSMDPEERASPAPRVEKRRSGSFRALEPLTDGGLVMGTPGYMSPEHLQGRPDARADQFSFCVALWEGLFGQRPFIAGEPHDLQEAVLAGHITEPPADRRIPQWLRRTVERGLSVDPEARFPDMDALLDALGRDPARTRRRIAGLGAVALAVGAAGIGWYETRAARCTAGDEKIAETLSPKRRDAARTAFESTGLAFAEDAWRGTEAALDRHAATWVSAWIDACEATHVRGEQSAELLDLRMACLERARGEIEALVEVFIAADATVVQHAVEAVGKLGSPLRCKNALSLRAEGRPSDPEQRAAVDAVERQLSQARSLLHAGHVQRALELALESLERAERLEHAPLEASAGLAVGRARVAVGAHKEAANALAQAVLAAERSGVGPRRAETRIELGFVVGYLGADHDLGRWHLQVAREILRDVDDREPLLAEVYSNEAVIEAAQGHADEAIVLFEWGLEILRASPGNETNVAVLLSNVAGVQFERGEYEDALRRYREVHEIQVSVFGDKHPSACESLGHLGNVLHAIGRSEEALEHHRRSIEICAAAGVHGGRHATSLNNEATVLAALSRYEEAIARYAEAIAIYDDEPEHPTRGILLSNMAEAYLGLGRHERALELFEQGMTIIEASLGTERIYHAVARAGAGQALLELGRVDEAIAELRGALDVYERVTSDALLRAEAEFQLARALVRSSDSREVLAHARDLAERARETSTHGGQRGAKLQQASQAWLTEHSELPSP